MIFNGLILINAISLVAIIFAKSKVKGSITVILVLINALITSWTAFAAFDKEIEWIFYGGLVFGKIPIRIDALSAWFILIMNFTLVTGILYGQRYMNAYAVQTSNLTIHYTSYVVNQWAMLGIYVTQHTLAFLCMWELMAISAFILVIFEHNKVETIKAGINYLIQSHICIIFLTIGFIWVISKTGSYDFNAISIYSRASMQSVNLLLFCCFFVAFAIKAGFVPFHTWLPYAHPAAPAHVSGVMSGVMIKLGIYGILRIILLINDNHLAIGYLILIVSIITGLYGVMLATIQHNLKKLLAYHSIENIGIIGIGIGVGSIGLGTGKSYMAFLGFAGALLHTLNHSLFKSLLFYCSGTIYQVAHTINLERLGGLIKEIPKTGMLFLLSALAICGLPPFNGFISEFFIYSGLFQGISTVNSKQTLILLISIFSLVVIGGLAMICFTKAFSIAFLGNIRHSLHETRHNENLFLFPKYFVALFIVAIGLFPQLFAMLLLKPVLIFGNSKGMELMQPTFLTTNQFLSISAFGTILLPLFVIFIKRRITAGKVVDTLPTWNCGYEITTPQLQYTANSFVRSYRKLIQPILVMNKKEDVIADVFPNRISFKTNPYDKIESIFIDFPLRKLKALMGSFKFLQNGSTQFYVLYGVGFILLVLVFPLLLKVVYYVVNVLNQI